MLRYFLAPLFWAIIILFFSSIPSSDLPDFSFWKLISFDKFAHVCMYSLLSFLIMKACFRQYSSWFIRYNAIKVTTFAGIIYGGFIELLQEYALVDRYGDWMDMVANAVGVFLGIVVFRLIFFEYIR
jgi:VanZ family protein